MKTSLTSLLLALILGTALHQTVAAQNINLEPKYGLVAKTEQQQAADQSFLDEVDRQTGGDRAKAAEQVALLGWSLVRKNAPQDAMRRFNQAWLLDHSNGPALWGMAVLESAKGKRPEALKLMAEAEPQLRGNVDFEVDYAKAVSVVGLQTKDKALLADAAKRFDAMYQQHPDHAANLQNWAILLYYTGDYRGAWSKIQLAENAPGSMPMDAKFIAALEAKMARPGADAISGK
jgi:tetratricopeptide (TPR) repeat protein